MSVGESGTLTTLMVCSNAAGNIMLPFLIFKGSIALDASSYPSGVKLHCSKSGYMESELFLEFLKHFQQHRVQVPNKKVLLILDGHKTHVTLEAVEFCSDNEIELWCLPPHSTHRLQSIDTHFNGPLKKGLSQNVTNHLTHSDTMSLTRKEFHLYCVTKKSRIFIIGLH